jgi:hypothetical protein
MTKRHKTNVVKLTQEEAEAFKMRIVNSSLAEHDQKIVLACYRLTFGYKLNLDAQN